MYENSSTKKETFQLKINWYATVYNIKQLIRSKKNIPLGIQHLYFGNGSWVSQNKLRNNERFYNNEIQKRVYTNGLSLMLYGNVQVYNDANESSYHTEIEAFETIKEVKSRIYAMEYVQRRSKSKTNLSKFFGTNSQPTLYIPAKNALETLNEDDDEKTLYEYGLEKFFNGTEFILTKFFPAKFNAMQIFMRCLHDPDNPIKLQCFNFTTIETLKQKTQEALGVQPDVQILIFENQRLEDGRTLEDYNIINNSTIHFRMIMRGD